MYCHLFFMWNLTCSTTFSLEWSCSLDFCSCFQFKKKIIFCFQNHSYWTLKHFTKNGGRFGFFLDFLPNKQADILDIIFIYILIAGKYMLVGGMSVYAGSATFLIWVKPCDKLPQQECRICPHPLTSYIESSGEWGKARVQWTWLHGKC